MLLTQYNRKEYFTCPLGGKFSREGDESGDIVCSCYGATGKAVGTDMTKEDGANILQTLANLSSDGSLSKTTTTSDIRLNGTVTCSSTADEVNKKKIENEMKKLGIILDD